MEEKIAILVVSCDKFSDVWLPYFKLFWRFWPDCPFNIYLLSNNLEIKIPKVNSILVGDDVSWSDNLLKGISNINEKYIFLLLDDFFLTRPVVAKDVMNIFNWIVDSDINYARLTPTPKPDKMFNDIVGIVSKGTIYRTSTIMSVWKKSILSELLRHKESAWDFEMYGSIRSDDYDEFYSTWEKHFHTTNVVIKGKWQRYSINKIKSLGVSLDLNKREVMSFNETIILFFKIVRTRILSTFPAEYRRRVKDWVLSGKYRYNRK